MSRNRFFYLLFCATIVLLLPTNAIAAIRFVGSSPVVIDGLIDDDVIIISTGPVSILHGARITGNLIINRTGGFLMSGGVIEGSFTGGFFQDPYSEVVTEVLKISGGEIRSGLALYDEAIIDIQGGLISGPLLVSDSTTLILRGNSFNFPYGPIAESSGQLTGMFADGSSFSVKFTRNVASSPLFNAKIILVPEPSSSTLAGLAFGVLLFAFTNRTALISRG